jgi:hypothetical protein
MSNYMSNDPRNTKRQLQLLEAINEQLIVMNNLQLVYLYSAFGQGVTDQWIDSLTEGDDDE